jgi:hypothetical protein
MDDESDLRRDESAQDKALPGSARMSGRFLLRNVKLSYREVKQRMIRLYSYDVTLFL